MLLAKHVSYVISIALPRVLGCAQSHRPLVLTYLLPDALKRGRFSGGEGCHSAVCESLAPLSCL